MNSTEMMERFRHFASVDLSLMTPDRMHQVSEVLLETSAVRIVLTRDVDRTEGLDIDVEVSLPSLPESADMASLQNAIDRMIATLQYLKRLTSLGFGLELLQEEGILVASTVLSDDTEEDVFSALRPPE